MKFIWIILLSAVSGFLGYSLWSESVEKTKVNSDLNHTFLNGFEDVISWEPNASSVNIQEIPNWNGLSSKNKAGTIFSSINDLFSKSGVSSEMKIRAFLNKNESLVILSSNNDELEAVVKYLFKTENAEFGEYSKNDLNGLLSGENLLLTHSKDLLTSAFTEDSKEIHSPLLNGKLVWKSEFNASQIFEREEIPAEGAGFIEFKKRNGFLYGYCFLPDTVSHDETIGVTYSIWDFQLPGSASSFTIEPFPIRNLVSEDVSEVEDICECDVKTAWKSWNTHQVYLFNQDDIQFYGIQVLEDLPASSGLYPFIADDSKMYKGYQIQSLISGAEVGGLYAEMFGREVSQFIDLEEQVFFFSSFKDAKTFINVIQNKPFGYLVDQRLQEMLLLSPDYTEYESNPSSKKPMVYQFEQQDNGRYYHALWKGEQGLAFANNSSEPQEEISGEALQRDTPNLKWETELDGNLIKTPFVFTNHYTQAKEVAVVTDKNTLGLIDASGKLLWTKSIDEPILGNLHQVDLFRNNKFQLVFSTATKLYAVDRNGKDIDNFPVKLTSQASAAVSVMDYDKKRNYRLLVPLKDGSLLNYDKDGKEVRGWKHKKEDSPLISQISHTIIGRKDYLVGAKENGKVAIYKRDGKTRILKI